MSKFIDANVTPGPTGTGLATDGDTRLQVYLLTTAVAMASTIFPGLLTVAAGGAPASTIEALWLNFVCDDGAGVGIGFYVFIGGPGAGVSAVVPDPAANVTAPLNITQQCIFVPAGAELHRKFVTDQSYRAIQVSGANAFLRVEATSEVAT